jgi:branched-chain amino acid transport system permease protein
MADFLQLVVAGLATGSIYALAAIGFTLLWQTSQTINFAQGEFVMVPAFFALACMKFGGLPFLPSCIIAIAASLLLLGLMFKGIIVDPLLGRGVLPMVISTIGLGILLKDGVKDLYSAEAQPFPTVLPEVQFSIFGAKISLAQIGVILVAVSTIIALSWFLQKTLAGRMMQATAQNPAVAKILGINIERMILYTFLINAGLAAIASILVSPIYFATFQSGERLGIAAFVAAIIGGFNQVGLYSASSTTSPPSTSPPRIAKLFRWCCWSPSFCSVRKASLAVKKGVRYDPVLLKNSSGFAGRVPTRDHAG